MDASAPRPHFQPHHMMASNSVDGMPTQAYEDFDALLREITAGLRWLGKSACNLEDTAQTIRHKHASWARTTAEDSVGPWGKQCPTKEISIQECATTPIQLPQGTIRKEAVRLEKRTQTQDSSTPAVVSINLSRPISSSANAPMIHANASPAQEIRQLIKTTTTSKLLNIRDFWCLIDDGTLEKYKHQFDAVYFRREDPDFRETLSRIVKEKPNEPARTRLVLHPSGPPRILWNILSLLFILYDILAVPLLAFELKEHMIPDLVLLDVIEWMCTIWWTFDILVAFRTGFYHDSELVMKPGKIASHYAQTWMLLDFAIAASDWLTRFVSELPVGGSVLRTTRIFRITRSVRLLRLAKFRFLWASIENQMSNNVLYLAFSVIKLTAGLCIIVHLIACGWYAVGASTGGWTTYYGGNNSLASDGLIFWYFASSRWTLAQINGRTDMDEDANVFELLYTCVIAICFAVIYMAIFISSITATMMELSSLSESKTQAEQMVNRYIGRHHISHELTGYVKHHMEIQELSPPDDNEDQRVLSLLPQHLAKDLLYEVRKTILSRHLWIRTLDESFPRVVRQICSVAASSLFPFVQETIFDKGDSCIRVLFVDKGDLTYDKGDSWNRMLFVEKGDLPDFAMTEIPEKDSPTGDNNQVRGKFPTQKSDKKLQRGDWLSDAALWIEWIHRGRLKSDSTSSLIALDVMAFADTVRQYRQAYALTTCYAQEFVSQRQRMGDADDLPVALHKSWEPLWLRSLEAKVAREQTSSAWELESEEFEVEF